MKFRGRRPWPQRELGRRRQGGVEADFDSWLQRSLDDDEISANVREAVEPSQAFQGMPPADDDKLVTSLCIALDQAPSATVAAAPIWRAWGRRWRPISTMRNGFAKYAM